MNQFPVSYEEITHQLDAIAPAKYAATRNYINGAVTYLSPYISRGVITTKQVMNHILLKGYRFEEAEKLIQELAWRDYFQRVWQEKGTELFNDLKQPQQDAAHDKMLLAVEKAETGIESIDSAISHLYATGYMHNHLRMYTASVVCNIGKAHWQQPSQWMYYHLLDGDVASNTCSWQWVAGTFSSKKYYCNQENINKYTFSKQQNSFLDVDYGQIQNIPIPDVLQQTASLELITNLPATQKIVIESGKPVLLYNSYNLDPHWRKEENANRILMLEPSHFKKYPVSERVIDFIIDLSKNIEGVQLYCGEVTELLNLTNNEQLISKEHPAFSYYPGIKDARDWMCPEVTGYYTSFFSYWKKCEKYLKQQFKQL